MTVFKLLKNKTRQKLQGIEHIENRLVSLDELDARPIKKGKAFPSCEFGSTMQIGFNQQGFMVTVENFIGQPIANSTEVGYHTMELFSIPIC